MKYLYRPVGCLLLMFSLGACSLEGPTESGAGIKSAPGAEQSERGETSPSTVVDELTDEEFDAAMDVGPEDIVECTDLSAIAKNSTKEPAGWPKDWTKGNKLPNPECHPDFIELKSWKSLKKFNACWDGIETGALGLPAGASQQDKYEIEWEASKARSDWFFPKTDKPIEEGNPGCVKAWEDEFK